MRDKHVFLLYVSSSLLKKRLTSVYGLTLMPFFIKIMMENYKACPIITPNSFFFRKGNYGTPFLTIWCHIAWNWFQISEVHYLFVFTSQTNKSPLNWVVLILIKENIILKMQNQDFPPNEIEYVITLLKWLVRLIFFFGSI